MRPCLFLMLLLTFHLSAQDRPNILWIVCEDISPNLSMYGDATANTPNLDALAAEGLIFENAFAPVGVCAPTRSSIITGMYPTSIGTMQMRTGKDVMAWGRREYQDRLLITDLVGDTIREYAAVTPPEVRCFTEYLRAAGYYCTNNQKTDYQFAAPLSSWDENGNKAHWRNRPENMPFFSVFNIGLTHESRIWLHADKPLTVNMEQVPVPPYLLDTETTRRDVARHYSNIELMDAEVGRIIRQLKEDGLYERTIIFFYSDHGGPLPRQKREVYDSGLRVPLLVRGNNIRQGSKTERMVSLTDLGPTVLSLAGLVPPDYMDGKAFLGDFSDPERQYIYGSADRFDEYTDRVRIIRTARYLYIRNFLPNRSGYKDITYRKQIPSMVAMLEAKDNNTLDPLQSAWFLEKDKEELYDCIEDPHNLNNLVTDPSARDILKEMQAVLLKQLGQYPDLGQIPEALMIDLMWPGGNQPNTAEVVVKEQGGSIQAHCSTQGASISWLIRDKPDENPDYNSEWKLYTSPLIPEKGKFLYLIAERIGYRPSGLLIYPM